VSHKVKREQQILEFESALSEAADKFFNARPLLSRNVEHEFVFSGGFRMAWDLKNNEAQDNEQ